MGKKYWWEELGTSVEDTPATPVTPTEPTTPTAPAAPDTGMWLRVPDRSETAYRVRAPVGGAIFQPPERPKADPWAEAYGHMQSYIKDGYMDFERVWEDLKARRIPHDKVFRWLYTLGIKDSNRRYFKHMSPDAYTEEQEAKWDEEAARAKPGPGERYSENFERYYEELTKIYPVGHPRYWEGLEKGIKERADRRSDRQTEREQEEAERKWEAENLGAEVQVYTFDTEKGQKAFEAQDEEQALRKAEAAGLTVSGIANVETVQLKGYEVADRLRYAESLSPRQAIEAYNTYGLYQYSDVQPILVDNQWVAHSPQAQAEWQADLDRQYKLIQEHGSPDEWLKSETDLSYADWLKETLPVDVQAKLSEELWEQLYGHYNWAPEEFRGAVGPDGVARGRIEQDGVARGRTAVEMGTVIPASGRELGDGYRVMSDYQVYHESDPSTPVGSINPETGDFREDKPGAWDTFKGLLGQVWKGIPLNPYWHMSPEEKQMVEWKRELVAYAERQGIKNPEQWVANALEKKTTGELVIRATTEEEHKGLAGAKVPDLPWVNPSSWEMQGYGKGDEFVAEWIAPILTMQLLGLPKAGDVGFKLLKASVKASHAGHPIRAGLLRTAGAALRPTGVLRHLLQKAKHPPSVNAPRVAAVKTQVTNIQTRQARGILPKVTKPTTRPSTIGTRSVITSQTESKIQTLKKNLGRKGYLTDDQYNAVLKRQRLKVDRWVDDKTFISEEQGQKLLRALLREAETGVLRRQNVAAAAVEKNPAIKAIVNRIDNYASKKYASIRAGTATVSGRDVSKMHVQSARYAYQGLEAQTGKPFHQINNMIINQKRANDAALKSIEHYLKESAGGSRALRAIKGSKESLQRISDFINHQNKWDKTVKYPTGITETEKAVANAIQKVFKEVAPHYRYHRFTELYSQMAGNAAKMSRNMHAPIESVQRAINIYETKGPDALRQFLNKQTWGTMKSGFDPRFVLNPKLATKQGKTVFATGRLKGRTVDNYADALKFLDQDKDIIDRVVRYSQQMANLNLRPYVRSMESTLADSAKMFSPKDFLRVQALISQDMLLHLGYQPPTLAGSILQKIVSQPFKTIFGTNPILPFRNLFQNLALAPNKMALINPLNKKLTAWERHYFDVYVQQMGGLREMHYLEGSGWKIFSSKYMPVNRFIDWVNLYGRSDKVNRLWSFWAHKNHAQRAVDTYLKDGNLNKFLKNSGIAQLTPEEQAGVLRLLAQKTVKMSGVQTTSGPHAAACEIGKIITDNVHLIYERSGRAAFEKGELGRAISSLVVYPRAVSERYIMNFMTALKPGSTATPYAKKAAWETLGGMLIGSLAANKLFEEATGRTDQPYRPWAILEWTPGGLVIGSIEQLGNLTSDIAKAITGDNNALRRIPTHVARTGDTFIPFYKIIRTSLESALGQKYLDRLLVRQVISALEKSLWGRGLLNRYAVEGELYQPNAEFYEIERTTKQKILHALFGTEQRSEDYAERMLQSDYQGLGETYLTDEDTLSYYTMADYRAELYQWGDELGLGTMRGKDIPLINEYIAGREKWDEYWEASEAKREEMIAEDAELLAHLLFWGYRGIDIGDNPAAAPLLLKMIEKAGVKPEAIASLTPLLDEDDAPQEDKFRSLQLLAHLVEEFPELVEWQQQYLEAAVGEERDALRRENPMIEAMKYIVGDFVGLQNPIFSAPIILAYMEKNNIKPEEIKAFKESPEDLEEGEIGKYAEMVRFVTKLEALPVTPQQAYAVLQLVDAGVDYMDNPLVDAIASWLDAKSSNLGLPETPDAWDEWDEMLQRSGLTYTDILGEELARIIEPLKVYYGERNYVWDDEKGEYVERKDTFHFSRSVRYQWPEFNAWGMEEHGWQPLVLTEKQKELYQKIAEERGWTERVDIEPKKYDFGIEFDEAGIAGERKKYWWE